MNFKKILSVVSACVVTAAAGMNLITASAAVREITYTGPSSGAFAKNDDGSTLRFNIYNEWVNPVIKDMNNTGVFEDAIDVTFTVSGLTGSVNKNDDGSDGEPYAAELVGTVGTDQFWGAGKNGNTVTNDSVLITGNGQYTVSFNLSSPADTVLCLILSTNINAYNYDAGGNPEKTGITFNIDRIVTQDSSQSEETTEPIPVTEETTEPATGGVEPTPTDPTDATETEPTTNAPATSANTRVTTIAANANNNSNNGGNTTGGNQVSNSTSGSPTTKGAGIAAAFAGLALTAGVAVLTKVKRK